MIFQSTNILFNGPMTVSNNRASVMQMHSCNVTFNGSVNIYDNKRYWCDYIIQFHFCNILFSRDIFVTSNLCRVIIILKSHRESAYITVMPYSNITFTQNKYINLITFEIDPAYNNPYPFCLFQYVTLPNLPEVLPSHYDVIISDNFTCNCYLSFHHFISHCKWMPTAAFHGHNSRIINCQIIKLTDKTYHGTIFPCQDITNKLGPVYPGQALQVQLCIPCSNNYSALYVETHNTLLPQSACKIAYQTEQVNFITNNSKTIGYTIVSEANDSCELFLTVSPFLYYIYEVFDVQLLPIILIKLQHTCAHPSY